MVDMQVAISLDGDVDAGMAGEQVQHVVEKANAGRNLGDARSVEVHADLDIGFLGLALDRRRAHEMGSLYLRLGVEKTRPFNRPMTPSLLRDDRPGSLDSRSLRLW